jgi:hypothetical protein
MARQESRPEESRRIKAGPQKLRPELRFGLSNTTLLRKVVVLEAKPYTILNVKPKKDIILEAKPYVCFEIGPWTLEACFIVLNVVK